MQNFDWTQAIGLLAAMATTFSFLPQVIRTYRMKSAKDISFLMFLLLCFGVVLWLIYGILKEDWPIILANGITLCLTSTILYYKIKFD